MSRAPDDAAGGTPAAPEEDAAREILEALRSALQELSEPVAVLEAILRQAVRRTGAERAVLVEVPEGGALRFSVLIGHHERTFRGDADAFSRNVFDRVLRTGETLRIENALDDPFFGAIESVRALRASSILCMPIRTAGRIAALVHLEDRRSGHFTAQHETLLRSLLDVAEPVLASLHAGREAIEERDRLRTSQARLSEEAEADRRWFAAEWSFGRFVGHSPAIRGLEEAVAKAAGSDFPVLLLGEPGTGKNLLARVLHYGGARRARPFVTVFCPSLERGRVEVELFGHRRGAFTGADRDHDGRVQAADGGTLFLDEIGELPPEFQPKLLRFLQDRTFERVGDTRERTADVRIIAATNRDLALEVQRGTFRRDLYDRLNFLPIRVPPLRERIEDVPLLLRHCLDQTAAGRWVEVAPDALEYLRALDFTWPGNVRHIEQLAARLAIEGLKSAATARDVARLLDATEGEGAASRARAGDLDLDAGLPRLLEAAERAWVEEALRRYPDLSRADLAAKLRISEAALYRKLKTYRVV